jgi:hypothetical protein
MAKLAGRNGSLYMGLGSAGTAEPVAYLSEWSVSFTTDKFDVTSFGDVSKTYVAGLPDFSGNYKGWYDTATAQMYTAATDGVARKFYLYPTTATTTQYWFGTALFDFSIDVGVGAAISISGSFNAATASSKVG